MTMMLTRTRKEAMMNMIPMVTMIKDDDSDVSV
jgi:hypothetical protein